MKTSIYFALLVAAAVCLSFCSARRDDLFDYKISELGGTVMMRCNDSVQYRDAPNDTWPWSWMLPNLTVLESSWGRFEITDSRWSFTVHNVTIDDLGQYHCMMRIYVNETPTDWYLGRLGLNAQGPYFQDLWDKYELNTIIGLSSGFGFLALAIGTMLVYHFRYISPPDEEDESKSSSGTPATYSAFGAGTKASELEPNGTGMVNKAYEGNDGLPGDSEPSTSDNSVPIEHDEDGTAF
jgi:hypothetical protein